MGQENILCMHSGMLFSLRKINEVLPFTVPQMELEAMGLRETSQAQKEKYSSHSFMETKMLIWRNEVKWWSLETGKGVEGRGQK